MTLKKKPDLTDVSRTMRRKLPILVSRPHGSTHVPSTIREDMVLADKDITDYADLFTDRIFDIPQTYMVTADVSRLVVDLNRAPDHIIAQAELSYEGVVAAVTDHGKKIFQHPPNLKTIKNWIRNYHHPYHRRIKQCAPKVKFFIDGHSMHPFGPEQKPDAGKPRADIVLGNREYTTCSLATTTYVAKFFKSKGHSVKINDPYAGKYILGSYCSRHRLPGIQIEVNKGLYLDIKTLKPKKGMIEKLNAEMTELIYRLLTEHLKVKM